METTETVTHSPAIGKIAEAIALAQAKIGNPDLDSTNPHFKSKFASLAAHLNAVRPHLSAHGVSVMQFVTTGNGEASVTTMLAHSSGEWIRSTLSHALPDNANAQQLGSLVTYLRRYSLAGAAFIVGEADDDGNADANAPRTPRPAFKPDAARGAPKDTNGKDWPKSGITVGTVAKLQARTDGIAVWFDSEDHGGAWVKAPSEFAQALADAKASSLPRTVAFHREGDVIVMDELTKGDA